MVAATARVKGLRIDDAIAGVGWKFEPSIGLVAARVDKLGLDIRSFREPLKRVIQQVMAPSFKKNFDAEGRPDSWTPLSDATLAIREREGYGDGPILDRTGALKKTMQQLNIWSVSGTAAAIRDLPQAVWYGKVHQAGYGSFAGRIKQHGGDAKAALIALNDEIRTGGASGHMKVAIPQRQFVMIQETDYDDIEAVFTKWLQERIDRDWSQRGATL